MARTWLEMVRTWLEIRKTQCFLPVILPKYLFSGLKLLFFFKNEVTKKYFEIKLKNHIGYRNFKINSLGI